MPLLTCANAAFAYDGAVVLQGLQFSIHRGDFLCVVGANGSGKSTLLQGLLGLLPPVRGAVVRGQGFCAKGIGYAPQHTQAQRDFPASVLEVVLSGCVHQHGLGPWFAPRHRAAAQAALQTFALQGQARQPFRALSGGQQQRVLLARALCAAHDLLLLDEPAAGLDSPSTATLYATIERIHQQGMAIVMVTHDLPRAMPFATHVLHLQGEPLFFGTATAYAASPCGQAFLERSTAC